MRRLAASSVAWFDHTAVNGAVSAVGEAGCPLGSGNAFKNGAKAIGAEDRANVEGTMFESEFGSLSRAPSYEKKKNVLSFQIGAPRNPPKSLCRSGACFRVLAFVNQSPASKTLFRKYSNTP